MKKKKKRECARERSKNRKEENKEKTPHPLLKKKKEIKYLFYEEFFSFQIMIPVLEEQNKSKKQYRKK